MLHIKYHKNNKTNASHFMNGIPTMNENSIFLQMAKEKITFGNFCLITLKQLEQVFITI
jgi:hypothetical protein